MSTSGVGGGGGPRIPVDQSQVRQTDTTQQKADAGKQAPVTEKKVMDSFVRGNVPARLQALAGQKGVANLQFSDQALAQIAGHFATWIRKNAGANRKERARALAKLIMKHKKFGKIFDDEDEQELEQMFEQIAGQLDESPVLAQLVDEVTDWSLKSPIR